MLVDNAVSHVMFSFKLLGFVATDKWIEVEPDKTEGIMELLPPKTKKEIFGFLGRLQYISRFILNLLENVSVSSDF